MILNEETFPRFQWSKFLNGGRDEQFVVRANEWGDLVMGREKVLADLQTAEVSKTFAPSSPSVPDVTPVSLGVCKKCGSPNITYKTGRIGCSKYCWKNV